MAAALLAARNIRAFGGWPVPVVGKVPYQDGWPELRLDPAEDPAPFNGRATGAGVNLGASGFADLEADCLAAELVFQRLAPPTGCLWRHGKLCHRLYRSDAAHREWELPESLRRPGVERLALCEVRAENHQSVVPPSCHPNGGVYEWVSQGEPGEADPEALYRVAALGAVASGLAPAWGEGVREKLALALAGFLRRRGVIEAEALAVVEAVCAAAPQADTEIGKRLDAVRDTYAKPAGAAFTGWPALAGLVGEPLAEWLSRQPPASGAAEPTADSGRTPNAAPWPDPLAPEAFHGPAGDFVRIVEPHTESDPAALLLQFLTGAGSMLGAECWFQVEAARHPPRLFTVLVGDSSIARKGTSWGHARAVLARADEPWAKNCNSSGLSSGEGLIWAVRDPIETRHPIRDNGRVTGYETVISDPGVTDKRLLVVETEFASPLKVMEREGSTLSPLLRLAWDTGDLRMMTKNNPARATGAHIAVIGHITREEVRRRLDATEAANGFGNRFVWPLARRSKLLPEGGSLEPSDLNSVVQQLDAARQFAFGRGELKRDDEARELWARVYPKLTEDRSGLYGALTSRGAAQVVRLSLIYALLDASPSIRAEHLLAALAVWEYCDASVRFLFGDSLGDPVADEIVRALRNNPLGMSRTEIAALFARHQSAGRIGAALATLASRGKVRIEMRETGGRPEERCYAV